MKERFKHIRKFADGTMVSCYIKEQKKHWWSKWEIMTNDGIPLLYHKLPEGVQAVNELPRFESNEKTKLGCKCASPLLESNISAPLPIFPKGDRSVRWSMIDMVRNADEVYVGIKQDGKYYVAYDTETRQNLLDLQYLEIEE